MKPLILGVGNILLSDEGVGVRVVQELEKRPEFNRTLTSSMVVLVAWNYSMRWQIASILIIVDAVAC